MAVRQSEVFLKSAQEFAPSTKNDCILQIVYGPLVVCFVHLRVSLVSQHGHSIDSSLIASDLLSVLHELPGFNWITQSQRACEGINRFGEFRVECDSPPPSHDCLGFPMFLFQCMAKLIKCRCLIGTQSNVAFEQVRLH